MNSSPSTRASLQEPPPIFSLSDNPHYAVNSPATTRQSHPSNVRSSPHARHQSVPILPSPQAGINTPGQSRGLAKLTLVERLSKESIDSPLSESGSPKLMSPNRLDEPPPRPTHTPRRSRISLSIPPTKTAASPMGSPVRGAPSGHTSPLKHMSTGSLEEIIALSNALSPERQFLSPPAVGSLEEVAALDDANATFLTLIAFQERRVVELREELARAESELDLLKQQWTRQQLKLTRSARQEHVRQNSLTKLEQQITTGSYTGTPRTDRQEEFKSPQILVAGKRLAEGVKEGFFSMMDDLKAVAAKESAQTTPRQRGRSPTRRIHDDVGLGVVAEKPDPTLWYPKRSSSPMKRNTSQESDTSSTTHDTLSERYTHYISYSNNSPS